MIIVVYVDDLLICESTMNIMKKIQKHLRDRFKMTDLRVISHYLEMKVNFNLIASAIFLHQSTYIRKILIKFRFDDDKTVLIFMITRAGKLLVSFNEQINKIIIV